MQLPKHIVFYLTVLTLLVAGGLSACKKDYYVDSGLQNGKYGMSSLEFLSRQPFFFDTVVQVIHLAQMDDILADSNVTFFSPTDHAIGKAMDALNAMRSEAFKDSLQLADVPQEVWYRFLSDYIFREKYMLKDIARRAPSELNVYPGMNMESWAGYIMNLGVEFSDYEGTNDVGPRQLTITDIGDLANPADITARVATSDIQTQNGVIHVLDDSHDFGFSLARFQSEVSQYIY